MLCYWGSWSAYRPMQCAFAVDQIDPFMCTHIVYAFTKILDNRITLFDPWLELPDGGGKDMLRKLNDLRTTNPQLRTIIAIGGWNEGSKNYSVMASTEAGRRTFVDSVVAFLNRYRFDGFDLDWEYPTDRGGAPEDYGNYILLLKALKQALGDRYLLSAAVAASPEKVDQAYNVTEMCKYLDFMSVMGYDFFGAWDNKTGHNAPLRARQNASKIETTWNVEYAVNHWITRGAPPSKLLLGVPLYGRTFLLKDPKNAGFLAPSVGPGPMGPCSRTDGNLGYNEICRYLNEGGWTVTRDPDVNAPVAVKDNFWIGYDDAESLTAKVEFAMLKGLAGIMIWSMETDDFRGACRKGRNPLQTAIQTAMNTPIAHPTTSVAPPVTQESSTFSEAPQTSQETPSSTTAEIQTEPKTSEPTTTTEAQTEPKESEPTTTTEVRTEPREPEPTTTTEAQTEPKTSEPTTTTEAQTEPKTFEPPTTTDAQTEPRESEPTTTTEAQTEPKTSEPTTTTDAQTEPRESEPTTTTEAQTEPKTSEPTTTTDAQTEAKTSKPTTTTDAQTEPRESEPTTTTEAQTEPKTSEPTTTTEAQTEPKTSEPTTTTEAQTEPKTFEPTTTTDAQTESRESEPTTTAEAQTEPKTSEPTTTAEAQTEPKTFEPTTTTDAQTEPRESEPTTTAEAQTEPKTFEPTTTTAAQTEPKESEPTTTTQVKIEPTRSQAVTTTEFQTPTEVSQPSTTVEVQTEPTTSQTVMETKPSSEPKVFPPPVLVGEQNWPKCDAEGYYACPWNTRLFSRCVDMGYRNYLRYYYVCPANTIFNPAYTACAYPYQ
ncbi:endochitinase isoform X2 [Ixodes scapularis]|nr:endochitinase isoform X2 [Ixodes scapularis]